MKPRFLKSRIPQLRRQLAQKIVFYSHKLFGPFFLQEYRWKQPKTAAKEALQLISNLFMGSRHDLTLCLLQEVPLYIEAFGGYFDNFGRLEKLTKNVTFTRVSLVH